jgi:alpha-ketoglutarate-dependent taurine dioxygenase
VKNIEPKTFSFKKPGIARRKVVSISPEDLVEIADLKTGTSLPLLVKPAVKGLNLVAWAKNNRHFIETNLLKYGGILFRNFNVKSVAEFEHSIEAISGEMMEYTYRSTPRTHLSGKIYTSTEYPAERSIPLHNEMAYCQNWPMKIWFFCLQSARQGGETPIVDSRKVLSSLDPEIVERFRQKKVMYVRNYQDGLDLSWQNVFQTNNKLEVEEYCHNAGIEFEWHDNDRLKTCQVCQAVATHPQTGESVWFNQAHLFHVSNLEPKIRNLFLTNFNEEDLPRNAYYGDGSPIEASVIEEIERAYQQQVIIFPWNSGDILMLDNMLVAHGRMPFVGSRKVVVGMAEPLLDR